MLRFRGMANHEVAPEPAIRDYVAHLESEGYQAGVVKGSQRMVSHFARFLVGRPLAFRERVRTYWQPNDRILRLGPNADSEERRVAETKARTALSAYVSLLTDQGYRPVTIADYRLEAVWFVLFLLDRSLSFRQAVPSDWRT